MENLKKKAGKEKRGAGKKKIGKDEDKKTDGCPEKFFLSINSKVNKVNQRYSLQNLFVLL